MQDDVCKEYLRRVSDALDRTGHPLRLDVLEELRSHLESARCGELEKASIDDLIERFGSPEEYVENISTQTVPNTATRNRRRVSVIAVILVTIIGAGLIMLPDRYVLSAYAWETLDRNYLGGSRFFDLDRARSLERGMTGDQVRSAIGIPWTRYPGIGLGREDEKWRHLEADTFSYLADRDESVWVYTLLRNSDLPFFTACNVIVGDDDRVRRVEISRFDVPLNARHALSKAPRSRYVGDALLYRPNGSEVVVPSDDPHLLIKVGFSPADDVERQIQAYKSAMIETWDDVSLDDVQFAFMASRADEMTDEQLRERAFDASNNSELFTSENTNLYTFNVTGYTPGRPFAVMLYKSGFVYEYPLTDWSISSHIDDDGAKADLKWLMRKLLEST